MRLRNILSAGLGAGGRTRGIVSTTGLGLVDVYRFPVPFDIFRFSFGLMDFLIRIHRFWRIRTGKRYRESINGLFFLWVSYC